jgi:CelD/BcsL family acetyltransferase involved in cellulose biosynthesis
MSLAQGLPAADFSLVAAKPSALRVQAVRSVAALEFYEEAWNRLAWEAPYCPPAQSGAWTISNFETVVEPGQAWVCLLAFEDDQLVGVLPLLEEPRRILGFHRTRLTTPQRGEMFAVEFLTASGRAGQVIPRLLQALGRECPDLHEIVLPRIPASSPTLSVLRGPIRGYVRVQEFGGRGSYLKIAGRAEDYRKALSHNFSRNLTRARNKLAKLPDVRTLFLTGSEAEESWLPRFLELEASGWKGQSGSAIKHKPVVAEFYKPLIQRLRRAGWLEWHLLLSEDRLLAAHLALKMNRRLILYKIAYDEAFAHCAPGNLLLERALERAFAGGDTDEVDCLTDCPWHSNWAMQKRTFYDVWLYPRRFLSLATGVALKRAKAGLRRVPGLPAFYHYLGSRLRPGSRDDAPDPASQGPCAADEAIRELREIF